MMPIDGTLSLSYQLLSDSKNLIIQKFIQIYTPVL